MCRAGEEFFVPAAEGIAAETRSALERDGAFLGWLCGWAAEQEHRTVRRGEELFYSLPPYVAAEGIERLTAVRLDGSDQFLVYLFREAERTGSGAFHPPSVLHLIMKDVSELVRHQTSLRQLTSVYTSILKKLSQLLDNLTPYTVGYSEQMSRYSIIIAQEMGLPDDVVRDVALAAYLSNIGMLGISTELYQKEGKYTEQEFEMMKLHSEVGAQIVRVITGNERAAAFIMHHHERMDGNGYPAGLKGGEIPVGSRILAVVQTFLAKINGRMYREPLSFHLALKTLQTAAGTQLDADIVNIFIRWFQKKQMDPKFNGRSLGNCWEMNCTPSIVCEHCPAYGRTDINCWEAESNNCRAHGKQCETCFVRTEVATRGEVLKL